MAPEVLTLATRQALAKAVLLAERDHALADLVRMLDPSGSLSAWQAAGLISGRLRRFKAIVWPRITQGHREPRNALENLLDTLCRAPCPCSQRRLFDLLAELGL